MKISQAHDRVIRIALTLLALVSSVDLMCILYNMIQNAKETGGQHDSYIPTVVYIILFLGLAGAYWLKNSRIIRNILIIVLLGFTISSYLIAWPAFIFMGPSLLTAFNEFLLIGTILCALFYNNLDSFTSSNRVLLLFLKFISSFISLFYGAYILATLSVSGATILSMSEMYQNLVVGFDLVLVAWNVIFAVIIWLKIYRSWWSWVMTTLLVLEIGLPLILYAASASNVSIWSSIMIVVIIAVITLGMNYLNNLIDKNEKWSRD